METRSEIRKLVRSKMHGTTDGSKQSRRQLLLYSGLAASAHSSMPEPASFNYSPVVERLPLHFSRLQKGSCEALQGITSSSLIFQVLTAVLLK